MNRLAEWTKRRNGALVMGILNVTPDSFHDGGRFAASDQAIDEALRMESDGADIIDLGGESSRPGAEPVGVSEEMERVIPVLEGIRRRSDIPISIDTTKARVAQEALGAGASIVNDISALRADPEMACVVAEAGCCVILMHMLGTPETMQANPTYEDVVEEVATFLRERVAVATEAGIRRERIWVDPGIGFGKRLEHNLQLLQGIDRLAAIGMPILVGLSRKSFLGQILDAPSADRLEGTISANAVAIARGAGIIRVHDVKEGRRTADVAYRLRTDHA